MPNRQDYRPACMADITDRLDPDVQAALRDAFRAVQEVSARLVTALEKRTELMAARAVERAGLTGDQPGG